MLCLLCQKVVAAMAVDKKCSENSGAET